MKQPRSLNELRSQESLLGLQVQALGVRSNKRGEDVCELLVVNSHNKLNGGSNGNGTKSSKSRYEAFRSSYCWANPGYYKPK
jgi:hypothetical protein